MENFSSKLAALERVDLIPKVLMKELVKKAGYRILCARRVDTRYDRPTILLEIEHDGGHPRVTFLPARFAEALDDSELQEITDSQIYRVRCNGVTENSPNVLIWNPAEEVPSTRDGNKTLKRSRKNANTFMEVKQQKK